MKGWHLRIQVRLPLKKAAVAVEAQGITAAQHISGGVTEYAAGFGIRTILDYKLTRYGAWSCPRRVNIWEINQITRLDVCSYTISDGFSPCFAVLRDRGLRFHSFDAKCYKLSHSQNSRCGFSAISGERPHDRGAFPL